MWDMHHAREKYAVATIHLCTMISDSIFSSGTKLYNFKDRPVPCVSSVSGLWHLSLLHAGSRNGQGQDIMSLPSYRIFVTSFGVADEVLLCHIELMFEWACRTCANSGGAARAAQLRWG